MGNIILLIGRMVFASFSLFCCSENFVLGHDGIVDSEFCQRRWSEFVHDKQELENECVNETVGKMSPCCVAEKDYLLERFIMYNKVCGIEGEHFISLNLAYTIYS